MNQDEIEKIAEMAASREAWVFAYRTKDSDFIAELYPERPTGKAIVEAKAKADGALYVAGPDGKVVTFPAGKVVRWPGAPADRKNEARLRKALQVLLGPAEKAFCTMVVDDEALHEDLRVAIEDADKTLKETV